MYACVSVAAKKDFSPLYSALLLATSKFHTCVLVVVLVVVVVAVVVLVCFLQVADIVMNFTVFLATFIIAFTVMPKLAAVILACEWRCFR